MMPHHAMVIALGFSPSRAHVTITAGKGAKSAPPFHSCLDMRNSLSFGAADNHSAQQIIILAKRDN
jgi:hypothetical protein